jgi:hypothetical protein
MNNIKEIGPDPQIGSIGRGQIGSTQSAPESERQPKVEESLRQDTLQVDPARRDETRTVENAKLIMEELPDIRPDKVELARQRIEQGFYDRSEVLDAIAGKIANQELKAATESIDPKNVTRARNRLTEGYYEQQQILNQTAEKIIKNNL